ncbi:MAG: hypothetical protein IJ805_02590 [Lachnospiraceae bacterium]|nr:hypothetical protein [Lachnospiraceae bacterium]
MAVRKKKKKRRRRQRVYMARFMVVLFLLIILGAAAFLIYKGFAFIKDKASGEKLTVTTITVNKNGSIDETIIEDFDEGVYDEAELTSMINEEISRYGSAVEFKGLSTGSGKAELVLSFEDDDACAGFNKTVFYADSIESLKARGVQLPGEAALAGGTQAVVVSESLDVRVPKKIKYVSPGATVTSKNEKTATVVVQDGSNAVIVY